MVSVALVRRPQSVFAAAAERPRLARAVVLVAGAGVVSGAVDTLATLVARAGPGGIVVSGILPVLFLAYWLLDAWLVDAGAALLGRQGRRRPYLAVSALAFPALVCYALLLLLESAATRWAGPELASALGWLTLPALGWFLFLMILAIRAVYTVPPLNAFALALLPFAAIATALLVLLVALNVLHAAGAI
jgi:hypothetical protein